MLYSCSAVPLYGGHLGKFRYGPPSDYSGMFEAAEPGIDVKMESFLNLGSYSDLIVCGPSIVADHQGFIPAPINTAKVSWTGRKAAKGVTRVEITLNFPPYSELWRGPSLVSC